jgi:dodecin
MRPDGSIPYKLAFAGVTAGQRSCGLDRPLIQYTKEDAMSVAKVSEISATSPRSFEDAIQQGLTRASKTLRNVRGAWIKEQHVRCDNGKITEYQVNMMVTFILDD